MRSDLDALMDTRGVDWAVVSGALDESPEVHYLLRGARVSHALIFKQRGKPPTLVISDMERDEAQAAGVPIRTFAELGYMEIRKNAKGQFDASVQFFRHLTGELGVAGRVGLYGKVSYSWARAFLRAIDEPPAEPRAPQGTPGKAAAPRIQFVSEWEDDQDLFALARVGKDAEEVERIRSVGRRTEAVIDQIVTLLGGCDAGRDGVLRTGGGPLTIGRVKAEVSALAARAGLVASGTIFAQGRDGAVPHSRGDDAAPVRVASPIVFDIFPREEGGGYYFDTTRTICVGDVPAEAGEIHQTVRQAVEVAFAAAKVGEKTKPVDEAVSTLFESKGHPTLRSSPRTQVGYCHALGHGVGLELHERPRLSAVGGGAEVLAPGSVFTIEPGLYYPEKGIGVRIEDMAWARPDGTVENLSTYPKDLLVPLGKRKAGGW